MGITFEIEYEPFSDPLQEFSLEKTKEMYGELFYQLRELVNKHDPVELLDLGCPVDEYESEVKTIILKLDSNMSEEQIFDLIWNEYTMWFGDPPRADRRYRFENLAKDIHKWVRDKNLKPYTDENNKQN